MKKRIGTDPLVIARRIRAAGRPIYIPEDDGETRYIASNDLKVYQQGGLIENVAIDFGLGTGYKISLVITSNRPMFAISRFALILPWEQTCFYWLEDPLVIDGQSHCYRFAGQDIQEFERNQVINHYADVTHTFSRGESVRGYLLGMGHDSIPLEYSHGASILAFLVIFDQFAGEFGVPVKLWADRMNTKRPRKRPGVPRRGRLFDKRDKVVG
jgi:hypothetical protein